MSELESDRASITSEISESGTKTPAKKPGRQAKSKAGEGTKASKKASAPVEAPSGGRIKPRVYSAEEGQFNGKTFNFS